MPNEVAKGTADARPNQRERGLPSLPEVTEKATTRPLEVAIIVTPEQSARYRVEGRSIEEVRSLLNPKIHEIGYVAYRVDPPKYVVDENENVLKVTVKITYRKTLPVWPDIKRQGSAVRDLWNKFLSNLECHENAHVLILEENFKRLETNLKELKNAKLVNVAAVVNTAIDLHADAQKKFDEEETHHGTIDYGFCRAAIL